MNNTTRTGITSITVENFKGISEEVTIPIKPITLIFGANSAGKSTILHAMAYARELLERNNPDAGRTLTGRDCLDLGGFLNLVHGHDKERKIKIRFDYHLDDDGLPPYFDENEVDDIPNFNSFALDSFWLELEVLYNDLEVSDKVLISKYSIGINDEHIAEIAMSQLSDPMMHLNFEHSFFKTKDDDLTEFIKNVYENSFIEEDENGPGGIQIEKDYQVNTLFNFNKPFELNDWPVQSGIGVDEFNKFIFLISQFILRPGEMILEELQSTRYLGPIREIPPRSFLAPRRYDPSRWVDGMAAWDILQRYSNDPFIEMVNSYLSSIGLAYSLEKSVYKELPVNSEAMLIIQKLQELADDPEEDVERLVNALQTLNEKSKIKIIDEKNGASVNPQDIGVGVSQVIPVIVGAINSSWSKCKIFTVEQPELHLHPTAQCELMDVFLDQFTKFPDSVPLYLLETHSEHLILRLLRRMREGAAANDPDSYKIDQDDVAIVYVNSDGQETTLINLRISEDGEIIDPWPGGFFPERMKEMFGG